MQLGARFRSHAGDPLEVPSHPIPPGINKRYFFWSRIYSGVSYCRSTPGFNTINATKKKKERKRGFAYSFIHLFTIIYSTSASVSIGVYNFFILILLENEKVDRDYKTMDTLDT